MLDEDEEDGEFTCSSHHGEEDRPDEVDEADEVEEEELVVEEEREPLEAGERLAPALRPISFSKACHVRMKRT